MINPTFGRITKYQDDGRGHPFVVYLALNKVTGDFYVGATQKGRTQREMVHRTTARSGRNGRQIIYRAMRKYGEENFKFLTIKECLDYWDALESERAYIALLLPRYNMTEGGGGIKGHRHSHESKVKMSAAKKGKPSIWTKTKMPQYVRDRIAATRRAEAGVKILTEGNKQSLRANAKRANEYRRKPVVCLSSGIVYQSVVSAADAHSLTTGQISRLCKRGCKTRDGRSFAYVAKK